MERDAGDDVAALAQRQPRCEVGDEMQRVELDQQIVAEEAVDVEAAGLGVELHPGAGLHRVRGDREVGHHRETRVVA